MEKHGKTWKHMEKTMKNHGLPYLIYNMSPYTSPSSPGRIQPQQWTLSRKSAVSSAWAIIWMWWGKNQTVNPLWNHPFFLEDHPQRMEVNNFNMLCINNIWIKQEKRQNTLFGRNKSMSRSPFRIPVFLYSYKHLKTIHSFNRWDAPWDSNRPLTLLHHGVMPWSWGRYPLDPNGSFMASGIIWEMAY